MKLVVVGGGAAGMFAALAAKEKEKAAEVIVLERTEQLLSKVKISGGGRCNVTHACFEPKELIQNYPRGQKELLGPFHRFQPNDMMNWLSERGVHLKVEDDGRMFPVTDSSATIIDCFTREAEKLGVIIKKRARVRRITFSSSFLVELEGEQLEADSLILATGGSPDGYRLSEELGHTVIPPLPSLFSFNIPSSPLLDLSGIAVGDVLVSLEGLPFKSRGAILLTHWGFSGPAVLKLSAWAARFLHEKGYQAKVMINWNPEGGGQIPKKLVKRLVELDKHVEKDEYILEGKTTYKQEFVTAGGVSLKEIDFRKMESRLIPKLFFAGELVDIDGVTGGFNFQNAWTTGWIAGNSAVE